MVVVDLFDGGCGSDGGDWFGRPWDVAMAKKKLYNMKFIGKKKNIYFETTITEPEHSSSSFKINHGIHETGKEETERKKEKIKEL